MAKLRIEDPISGDLIVGAYVKFVENLFLENSPGTFQNYDDYVNEQPNRRADMLQGFVGGLGTIKQQTASGTLEAINNNNCRVEGVKDEKRGGGPRSRVTVPIPTDPVKDFTYLKSYAKQIHDLYDESNPAKMDKCLKFMFGAMLLTRCR